MNLDNVSQNTIEEPNYDTATFTNIDCEDYVGSWGSKTVPTGETDNNGVSLMKKVPVEYLIKAGETKTFPKFLVDQFALHLANKILLRSTGDFGDSEYKQGLIKRMKTGVVMEEDYKAPTFTTEEIKAELKTVEVSEASSLPEEETFEGLDEIVKEEVKVAKKPRTKKVASAEVTE